MLLITTLKSENRNEIKNIYCIKNTTHKGDDEYICHCKKMGNSLLWVAYDKN